MNDPKTPASNGVSNREPFPSMPTFDAPKYLQDHAIFTLSAQPPILARPLTRPSVTALRTEDLESQAND